MFQIARTLPSDERQYLNHVEAMDMPSMRAVGSKRIPSRDGRGSGPAPTNLPSKLKSWMEKFKFGTKALDKTNATSVLEPATPALQPNTPSGAEGMEVHQTPNLEGFEQEYIYIPENGDTVFNKDGSIDFIWQKAGTKADSIPLPIP